MQVLIVRGPKDDMNIRNRILYIVYGIEYIIYGIWNMVYSTCISFVLLMLLLYWQ